MLSSWNKMVWLFAETKLKQLLPVTRPSIGVNQIKLNTQEIWITNTLGYSDYISFQVWDDVHAMHNVKLP
jgi:hypothetical protein